MCFWVLSPPVLSQSIVQQLYCRVARLGGSVCVHVYRMPFSPVNGDTSVHTLYCSNGTSEEDKNAIAEAVAARVTLTADNQYPKRDTQQLIVFPTPILSLSLSLSLPAPGGWEALCVLIVTHRPDYISIMSSATSHSALHTSPTPPRVL